METTITPAGGAGKSGLTFFRQGPLDFNLTSTGIALTGNTNSKSELKKFIERLNVLAAVLPDDPVGDASEAAEFMRA